MNNKDFILTNCSLRHSWRHRGSVARSWIKLGLTALLLCGLLGGDCLASISAQVVAQSTASDSHARPVVRDATAISLLESAVPRSLIEQFRAAGSSKFGLRGTFSNPAHTKSL